MNTKTLPTYFISHGGGPWPYMKADLGGMYDRLEASLQDIPRQLGEEPRAVLIVSAHWEAPQFTVMTSAHPPMIYDYFGFPPHTYSIRYSAPGSPPIAQRVIELLESVGVTAGQDADRGFDHGSFVPLAVMYPQAQVPVVQLSLKAGLDPAAHLQAGRALAPLRDEGILIIGSGLTYHNLRNLRSGAKVPSKAFDDWLQQTLVDSAPAERSRLVLTWDKAPAAREAHPREEHLLPLMVALGAAEDEPGESIYHEEALFGGATVSSFRFGAAPVEA